MIFPYRFCKKACNYKENQGCYNANHRYDFSLPNLQKTL
nr:MAG TPA: hypothetical protein [Bacteriophage sp.]